MFVAGFWGVVLFANKFPKLSHVFGKDSPGLRILSSVYLAIAAVSLYAIILPETATSIALVLFPLQIVYKILSVFAVRNGKNPVIISNVVIVAVHSLSLYVLLSNLG